MPSYIVGSSSLSQYLDEESLQAHGLLVPRDYCPITPLPQSPPHGKDCMNNDKDCVIHVLITVNVKIFAAQTFSCKIFLNS